MSLSIDIGTCYSRAAFIADGSMKVVRDPRYGTPLFTSSIYVNQHNEMFFGQSADEQFMSEADPDRYQRAFSLHIGSQDRRTYLLHMPPDVLISRMMAILKKEAEYSSSRMLTSATISVSSHYTKYQRDLLLKAGRSAGFGTVELVEESIASTMFHLWSNGRPGLEPGEVVLICNLGGMFDAGLVWQERSRFCYNSLGGNVENCGGREFESLIYDDLKKQSDPLLRNLLDYQNKSAEALRFRSQVRKLCRNLIHELSRRQEASFSLDHGLITSSKVNYSLTRDLFNSMIASRIQQTFQLCHQMMQRANIGWERLSQVVLVGGSCAIPYVRKEWERLVGNRVVQAKELDMAVCKGAALFGSERQAHLPDLVDVLSPVIRAIKDIADLFRDDYSWVYPVLTYAEAVEYFVSRRPDDERVVKGAMLRLPNSQGQTFVQVFLDRNNEVVYRDGKPYGRRLLVREFDTELREVFGSKELVLVE